MRTDMKKYDIIVIGAGTAGMTAAIYALRGGKKTLVWERENIGGQIALSPKVQNIPSIEEISGGEFADRLFSQITKLGADFELENCLKIEKEGNMFTVTTDYSAYEAPAVILASGVKHRRLNVPGEEEFLGKGVYYCALCDGAFYTGQDVALVGDGNTALQYALLLSDIAEKLTVVTMFDKFFGEKALEDALRSKKNVEIIPGYVATEILGKDGFEGVRFKQTSGEKTFDLKTAALFVAIGQVADTDLYKDLVETDAQGFVKTDDMMRTSVPGLYAAGDLRVKNVRQVTTAASDGAVAATDALNYIATV